MFVISLVAHLVVGAVLALIPQKKLREVVAIALNEAPDKKDEKKPEPPKPAEHPAERPAHAAPHAPRAAAAPVPSANAAEAAPQFADLGLVLDSSAVGGLAIHMAQQPTAAPAPVPVFIKPKPVVQQRKVEPDCVLPLVKAHPLSLVRPSYTEDARRARVQGRVRIELDIDDTGSVTGARIVEGLGHGLDEAAVEAARRLKFSPARQCDKPVAAPFVLAMRFVLET